MSKSSSGRGALRLPPASDKRPVRDREPTTEIETNVRLAMPNIPLGDDACLVVMSGAAIGSILPLPAAGLEMGRSSRCGFTVDDGGVSRHHVRVVPDADANEGIVEDLGSKNGTWVNDIRIEGRTAVGEGDRIEIGDTSFKFLGRESSERAYFKAIRRRTYEDALTGVGNRKMLDETLGNETARAIRHGRALAFLMVDIDHFKAVNDTHGHVVGDAVLRQVAELIQKRIRRSEVVARYGGEEFGLILPETDARGAYLLSEDLRQRIASTAFTCGDVSLNVTASIGGAIWNAGHATPLDLVREADANLYAAKEGGRNQVIISKPPAQ